MNPLIGMTFITGLLASAHCLGMCGGLISALSLTENGRRCGLPCQLMFNLGRVTTYSLLGLFVGWLGSALTIQNELYNITQLLQIGCDIFIILIGLGSAGLFSTFNFSLLKTGALQLDLEKKADKLKGLPLPLAALGIGLLFGLMPCGMLYAMLLTAAQSADTATGMLMMLAFGLGTFPALLLLGQTSNWLKRLGNRPLKAAGIMVALIGSYNLLNHIGMIS
ncbi:hypothetical protein SAMN02745165_00590 [Malonomonas rubra DSM 5091]|uniref:Urease accessory protein UreH-like transmembrane domain-containing protein n=1 Tax=Malonomonas rubra DSM 5091 TaxID=1122189 RepID=A0A1M6D9P1_MALRU|nr:sulfite exporter TauE/SafE family protein [Malonomonas rubra]SHI69718.1 hypothetical protein SAMN02745165_00590 [Malonomonas rubra DSM 5091]